MHVRKKLNVMHTDTLTPGVKWCNEAYKNADVIFYNNSFFKKDYLNNNDNSVYFSSIIITAQFVRFRVLIIKNNVGTIANINNNINYK